MSTDKITREAFRLHAHQTDLEQFTAQGEIERLRAVVGALASMTMDGEMIDGQEFVMENDDAVTTLNALIAEARAALGVRP